LRRLVIGLAICLLSTHAYALGLGKLRVKSALDEPLRAEIELTSASSGDLKELSAALGSREDFLRAGVQRPAYLQALKFAVDPGSSSIKITTTQPAKEPFLHFVVSVKWAGGQLVREYTALLDPPLYAKERPPAVSSPKSVDSSAAMPAKEPSAGVMPPPAAPAPGAVTSGGEVRTGEYGPTVEGDTLWSIATKLDTSGTEINIFQIMLALQRENPSAFIDNNINLLKTGKVLHIGDIESINRISKEEATVAYQTQLQEWQARTGVPAEVAMAPPSTATGGGPAAQAPAAGKPSTGSATGPASGKEKDVLRIVQATLDKDKAKAAGTGSAGEIRSLKDQITTLEDSLASRELENKELRERVTLLEDQVKNAKRLMEIESAGLALAQKQAAEAEAKLKETQQSGSTNAEPEKMVEPEAKSTQAAVTPPPAPKAQAIKAPPPAPKPAASAAPAKPKAKAKPAATKHVTSRSRKPQKSWWQGIMDSVLGGDVLFMGALIAGVIVLAIGAILFIRRRRSIAEFEESILTGTALDGHTDTTESADGGGSDTSFLSDFGLGGMGSVQADEVDPLAEAEVYLAYGRDEQAEEVLREATTRNPDRHELKLKLLEIYQQRNDVKSFETLAEELYPASGIGDAVVWKKVVEMGRKVSPDNPLFSQVVTAAGAEDSTTTTTTTTTTTADSDLFATPSAAPATGAQDFPMPDSTLELDEELDRVSGLQQAQRLAQTTADDTEKTAKAATEDFPSPKPPELDFDLDLDEAGAASGERRAVSMPTTDTDEDDLDTLRDLDVDLGEEVQSSKPGAPDTTAVHAVAATDTAEITGFDLVDSDTIQTGSDEVDDQDTGEQEQWDDAATKLDLARAYIDMGDKAGARSIIDEVLKEGNPAQRQQAGELAAQLQ